MTQNSEIGASPADAGPGCQPTASASLRESSRSGIPDATTTLREHGERVNRLLAAIPDPAEQALDDFSELVRRLERERIVVWLVDNYTRDIEHVMDWPIWRKVLWAWLHPVRFARATAVAEAGLKIHGNEHRAAQVGRNPEGGDPQGLRAEHEHAVPPTAGCAQTPTPIGGTDAP